MNMVRTNFGFNNSCSFPSASFPKYSSYFRPKTPFCNISGRWYFRVPYCVFIKTAAGPYFLQWQRNFYMQRAKRERWEKREKEGQKERKGKEKQKKRESKAGKRKRAGKRRKGNAKSEMEKSRKLSSTMPPAQGFPVTKKPKPKVSALIKKYGNPRSK